MTLEQVLDGLRRSPDFMTSVTNWKVIPCSEAVYGSFPSGLDHKLREVLSKRGITRLYRHQSRAVQTILDSNNTVIVTPTASEKTLCYNLPVLNSIIQNPDSRALYRFPTKALSQDQVTELQHLIELRHYLEEHHIAHHASDRYHWSAESFPAEEISLRSAAPENIIIIDSSANGKVIGEVDLFSAPMLVHQDAVYLHEGGTIPC